MVGILPGKHDERKMGSKKWTVFLRTEVELKNMLEPGMKGSEATGAWQKYQTFPYVHNHSVKAYLFYPWKYEIIHALHPKFQAILQGFQLYYYMNACSYQVIKSEQ